MMKPNFDSAEFDEPWLAPFLEDMLADAVEKKRAWGGIDENLIGAYISGACTQEEKARMRQAIKLYPAVRECIESTRRDLSPNRYLLHAAAAVILAASTIGLLAYNRQPNPQLAANDQKASQPFIQSASDAVASFEQQAIALQDASPDSPQVIDLREQFANAPIDVAALAWRSGAFVSFMNRTSPKSAEQLAAELVTKVDRIIQAVGLHQANRSPEQEVYIKSVYEDVRFLPSKSGGKIAPKLVSFLLDERPKSQVGMIVPYFFHTMNETDRLSWDRIVALAGKDLPLKIVNVRQYTSELTPDSDFVRDFGNAIDLANERNVEVYAYITCDGGGKPLKTAQEEVRKWHGFYGKRLRGIFFDNQAMFDDGKVEFFRRLFTFTSELEPGWKIISATDNECDEAYSRLMKDSIICYKTNGDFPKFRGWEKSYGRERFGAMIFDVRELSEVEMRKVAAIFGWVYAADRPELKAIKALPDYLEEQAAFLKKLNTKPPEKPNIPVKPQHPGTAA